MTVTKTYRYIMITVLAVVLPGCAKPVSAPAPEDPPAQTVPEQPPEQQPPEDGDRDRKIDLDVDVEVGDNAERDQIDQP